MQNRKASFLILLTLSAAHNSQGATDKEPLNAAVAAGLCSFTLAGKKTGGHFAKHTSRLGPDIEAAVIAEAQQTLAAFKLPEYQTAALITATFAGTQAEASISAASKLTEPILTTYNQAMFTTGALDELMRLLTNHATTGADDKGCIAASTISRSSFNVESLCGPQDAQKWPAGGESLTTAMASAFSGIHSSPGTGSDKGCLLSSNPGTAYTTAGSAIEYAGGLIKVATTGGFDNAANFDTQKAPNKLFKNLDANLVIMESALTNSATTRLATAQELRTILADTASRQALHAPAQSYFKWTATKQPDDLVKYLKTTYGISAYGTEAGYEKALKALNVDMPTESDPQAKKPLFDLSLTELHQVITLEIRKLHEEAKNQGSPTRNCCSAKIIKHQKALATKLKSKQTAMQQRHVVLIKQKLMKIKSAN
uniref:Variant surface glycoprotein 1356 n=1 Tax=Trypanosoma brucei TaxID=5691 RepID=M4SV86_9TRYP|nr:variant surface glycoprotein 1356 [Trypanosoma brucei]